MMYRHESVRHLPVLGSLSNGCHSQGSRFYHTRNKSHSHRLRSPDKDWSHLWMRHNSSCRTNDHNARKSQRSDETSMNGNN